MKILFTGDSPTVDTGFGVVSRNLLKNWSDMGHEITVLGVNHFGEPYDQKEYPYMIYPAGLPKGTNQDEVFGLRKLWAIQDTLNADIVFMLNDPWVIDSYLKAIPNQTFSERYPYSKIVAYYPTDGGPIKSKWMETLNGLDSQVCYSRYAVGEVIKSNNNKTPKNLHQIYHGVDTSVFRPVPQAMARQKLGLPIDSFIVGMVARNQPRKRFDLLMKAFAEFSSNKPKAKLYLHTSLNDIGCDISDLSIQFGLKEKLILTEGVTPAHGVPTAMLNAIYNTFDVNALISLGDGFGLPVAESMATGCPQLVSGHSCLRELVDGHGGLTVKTSAWIVNPQGINTWGGVSDVDDIVTKLQLLYDSKTLRMKLAEEGFSYITQQQFTWEYAAQKFNEIFESLFHILPREIHNDITTQSKSVRLSSKISMEPARNTEGISTDSVHGRLHTNDHRILERKNLLPVANT